VVDNPSGYYGRRNPRVLIQRKLRNGRLPHSRIGRISIGPGFEKTCDGCETCTPKEQLMLEVALAGGRGVRGAIQFHALCFQLWNDERHT
jgi:hypothetical protein